MTLIMFCVAELFMIKLVDEMKRLVVADVTSLSIISGDTKIPGRQYPQVDGRGMLTICQNGKAEERALPRLSNLRGILQYLLGI